MENWNSANHDLFYGKDGDLTGSENESQEVSMLALHLLQSALVHVNTLLLQDILSEDKWQKRLTDADRRALPPLFWTHVNPYGRFELDMNYRLDLALGAAVSGPGAAPYAEAGNPAADGTAESAHHEGEGRDTRTPHRERGERPAQQRRLRAADQEIGQHPCPKDSMPSHSCLGCRQQEAAAFVVGESAEDPGPGESEQGVHIGSRFPDSYAAVSGDGGQV